MKRYYLSRKTENPKEARFDALEELKPKQINAMTMCGSTISVCIDRDTELTERERGYLKNRGWRVRE